MRVNRRRLLRMSGAWIGAVTAAQWLPCAASARGGPGGRVADSRRIALTNLHSGERLEAEYFRDGEYVAGALSEVERVLRDSRTGERHAIDPKLLDYLVAVAADLDKEADFSVISGYRSPATNQRLRERGDGVAQHSLHIQGRAIDLRIPRVNCADLATRALALQRGGVGYYRASDFVHLDTGPARSWRG